MMLQAVIEAIDAAVPDRGDVTPLHVPAFGGREWDYVKQCLDTGWVSSAGAFVDQFEADLADYTGAARAVAVVNGTAALHLALRLVGVEPGDEVIVPSLTFVATANAVAHAGAVPHFADVEARTLGLDAERLDAHLAAVLVRDGDATINRHTRRTVRAVVAMHTFGHPVDLDALLAVCHRHGLPLVEDAAEALGTCYRGHHVGHHGRVGVLSFNGNKILTTGGGGALLTDDAALADRAKHLSTTAKVPHRWAYHHDAVGYNYRLPNLNAALGCAQLEQLPGFLARKATLAGRYAEAFAGVEGVQFYTPPPFAQSNHWLNALLLDAAHAGRLEALLQATHDVGLLTRPCWTPLHQLPLYADSPRMDLPVTDDLAARIINLPSSPALVTTPADA